MSENTTQTETHQETDPDPSETAKEGGGTENGDVELESADDQNEQTEPADPNPVDGNGDGGTQTPGDKILNSPMEVDTTEESPKTPETEGVEGEPEIASEETQENGVEETAKPKPDDVDSDSEDIPVKQDESPPFDTQRNEIHSLLSKPLQTGQKWFLVHIRWFKQWKRFVGYDNWDRASAGDEVARPGPIDNTSLLDSHKLRRHQVDEIDYKLVPEEAWRKLGAWYGIMPDSIPISRRVVEYGKFVKQCKVEIYPLELKACLYPKESEYKIVRISRCDTIRVLEKKMRKVFEIESGKEVRIYNRYMTYTYELIKDLNLEAQDVGLFDGQCVLMEVRNQDASWPRITQATRNMQMSSYGSTSGVTTRSQSSSYSTSSNYTNTNYSYSSGYGYYSGRQPTTPGLCGLSNLGNTCFMNSGLQCLVHIPPVINYFQSGQYLKEINDQNPLGMKGELAKSFGELVKAMWSGEYAYLAPRDYKQTVGKFAPTFSGYAQQDSQEHISFLLDGLHEDLNRVLKKPYMELNEIEKPDKEAAEESWGRHLLRNKSIIVDTFQGQYKSTLVCPECNKVSITFDPFMYLSLPLPIKKTRNIKLTLIFLNPNKKPTYYKVKVPKNGRIAELCHELSLLSDVDQDHMFVCDVYSHRFHKIFDHSESVNGISERDDIFVYETPICKIDDPDIMCLPFYNREIRHTQYTSITSHSYVHHYLFGMPLILPLPRDKTTYRDLFRICVYYMRRYIDIPQDDKKRFKNTNNSTNTGDFDMSDQGDSGDSSAVDSDEEKKSPVDPVDPVTESGEEGKNGETGEDKNGESGDQTKEDDSTPREGDNANSNDIIDNGETEQIGDNGETVKSKPEVNEPEIVGEMEVDLAEAFDPNNAYVPQEFDISEYPTDLFKLKLVNAYGSAEMGDLRDDDKVLRLMNRSVIALEWNQSYRHYYNDAELKNLDEDESVSRKEVKKEINLSDCIKLFTDKETLSVNDPWYCPKCKDFRQATKQLEIWKIPDCLVIHLKRFSYTQYWRDKLDTLINFPLELDMTEYSLLKTQGSLQFELYGVSNHYGGLGGGHYTAYAKQKDSGKWYYFDDSSVSTHSQSESVVTKAGYLLFYVRKTCIPLIPSPNKNSVASSETNKEDLEPEKDDSEGETEPVDEAMGTDQ